MKNIDMALVYALWNEYAAAINSGDLERWMSLWADDGLLMAPGSQTCIGKEQIREALQAEFSPSCTRNMTIHIEEVCILGDRAYLHGAYQIEIAPKCSGVRRSVWGKFLDILVKQADGSWKIAIDCHNYSQAT